MDTIRDLISYGAGCTFGRCSLDEPSLIFAVQGSTLDGYLHRCTPSTLSTVLVGDYPCDSRAEFRAEVTCLESSGSSADIKRTDVLRRSLTERKDYERDVLYPLGSRGLEINLDDGALVNYLRFSRALQKVPLIEKKHADTSTWSWPTPLTLQDGPR